MRGPKRVISDDERRAASAQRSKAYRDRQRGGPPVPKPAPPHGTRAMAARERRQGVKPCSLCAQAERDYLTAWRQQR